LENFIQDSGSQDLLFSLVNYRRFHSWLISVSKRIVQVTACDDDQNQISSHLGLIRDDKITRAILKDEKTVVQGLLDIIASGNANVYELEDDDANSFLNLLQEVRKFNFISSDMSKYVVFGSFGTIP
jgi:hypothetical protein